MGSAAKRYTMPTTFNVGEECLYRFAGTASEFTGPFPPYYPTAGVTRPAKVIAVDTGVSPEQYTLLVNTLASQDAPGVGDYIMLTGIEYSASPTNGKVSKANWGQVPGGAVATALSAVQTDATNALNAASAAASASSDLSNVKTQQGSSTAITAGAAATVLLADGDRAVAGGKAVQADATLSLTSSNLLATATVTAKIQKSTDAGSTWTDVVTKVFTLTGAALNIIPATRDPAFSGTCDRATAGNVRTRLTVSCSGANITVNECGLTTRWGVTPN